MPAAPQVETFPAYDGEEPTAKFIRLLQEMQLAICLNDRLLHHILGIFDVRGKLARRRE